MIEQPKNDCILHDVPLRTRCSRFVLMCLRERDCCHSQSGSESEDYRPDVCDHFSLSRHASAPCPGHTDNAVGPEPLHVNAKRNQIRSGETPGGGEVSGG